MRWILILITVLFVGCSHGLCFEPVETLGDGTLEGFHYSDIKAAYNDNSVRASDTYVGRRIKVAGTVRSVNDAGLWLEGGSVSLRVPDDDRRSMSKGRSVSYECTLHSADNVSYDDLHLDFRSCLRI